MTPDERFDRLEQMIAGLDRRIDGLDRRMDTLDGRIDALSQNVDERFDRMTQFILDFRQETASRFQVLETRMDLFSSSALHLEAKYGMFSKASYDFGAFSTSLLKDQSAQKSATTELASRVEKLEGIVSKLVKPAA